MKRGGLLFLALIAVPSVARAQAPSPSDQRLAEALFDEGRTLMAAGKFAEACPKLAESERLDPGGGTLLNLALCHESEGKVATAQIELDAAKRQAQADKRPDREKIATEHLAAIAPKIPKLTVRVLKDEPTLEVKVDGAVLPKPAWGVPVATDPGKHVIEASAQWKVPVRLEADVAAGTTKTVDVPGLLTTSQAYATPNPQPEGPIPQHDYVNVPDAPIERPNVWYKVANTTMVIGFVAASITGAVWLEATIERRSACVEDRSYCSSGGLDAADRERTWGALSIVGLSLGVGGLVAAAILPKYKLVQPTAQGMIVRF